MTLLRATKAELYNSNNIYKIYLQQYLNNRITKNSSINHENETRSNSNY